MRKNVIYFRSHDTQIPWTNAQSELLFTNIHTLKSIWLKWKMENLWDLSFSVGGTNDITDKSSPTFFVERILRQKYNSVNKVCATTTYLVIYTLVWFGMCWNEIFGNEKLDLVKQLWSLSFELWWTIEERFLKWLFIVKLLKAKAYSSMNTLRWTTWHCWS